MPVQRSTSVLPPTETPPIDRQATKQPQPRHVNAGRMPLVSTSGHEAEANITQVRHRLATERLISRTTQNPGEPENPLTKPSSRDRRPPTRPTRLGALGPSPDRPRRRPSGSGPKEDPHQTTSSPNVLYEDVTSPDAHQKRQASSPWRRNAETTGPTPGSSPQGALANVHIAQGKRWFYAARTQLAQLAAPMFPSAQKPSPFKRSHPRGDTGHRVQVCRLYVTHADIEVNLVAADADQPNMSTAVASDTHARLMAQPRAVAHQTEYNEL